MAMASKALVVGFRGVGVKSRLLLCGSNTFIPMKTSVAGITGRSSRVEPEERPAPWPYMERGYTNFHAYLDGTKKRIGENSKVIVVEGPQAIGKSVFARSLAEELEMKYFPMVTDDHIYINRYGYDLRAANKDLPPHLHQFDMSCFIKDPKHEKAILLQYLLWMRKFKQYTDALAHVLNTGQGVVLDRCVYSDTVFTDTLVDVGYIQKHERGALQKMKNKVMKNLLKPHLVVYLDAPASVVETNLKNRGRGEEKVWNREMLEKFEHNYKQSYLKTISEHAELLAYDWSTPGDAEIVVEDIEKIDFDRFETLDPKMEDWRLNEDWDWSEKRWDFTTRCRVMISQILNTPTLDTPILDILGEDQDTFDDAIEKIPGQKYGAGFNPDMGDKVLFRQRARWVERWPDYDIDSTLKKG